MAERSSAPPGCQGGQQKEWLANRCGTALGNKTQQGRGLQEGGARARWPPAQLPAPNRLQTGRVRQGGVRAQLQRIEGISSSTRLRKAMYGHQAFEGFEVETFVAHDQVHCLQPESDQE